MFTDQAALAEVMGEITLQKALGTVHRQMDILVRQIGIVMVHLKSKII
jgi:glycogen synthase